MFKLIGFEEFRFGCVWLRLFVAKVKAEVKIKVNSKVQVKVNAKVKLRLEFRVKLR